MVKLAVEKCTNVLFVDNIDVDVDNNNDGDNDADDDDDDDNDNEVHVVEWGTPRPHPAGGLSSRHVSRSCAGHHPI